MPTGSWTGIDRGEVSMSAVVEGIEGKEKRAGCLVRNWQRGREKDGAGRGGRRSGHSERTRGIFASFCSIPGAPHLRPL